MLSAMVAGFYDTNEMYNGAPCMEYYAPESCFGMQDACTAMPCIFHASGAMRMIGPGTLGPPGSHIVQQVVDENGALLHVLLPSIPLPLAPPPPYNPNTTAQQATYFTSYPTFAPPPQYQAVPCNGGVPLISSHKGSSSPLLSPEDRRQYLKFKKKSESRNKDFNSWSFLSPTSSTTSSSSSHSPSPKHSPSIDNGKKKTKNGFTNGTLDHFHSQRDEAEVKLITKLLSSIQPPTVSEITTTSALVRWMYPDMGTNGLSYIGPYTSPFLYEVLVADNDHEGQYKIAYSGSQLEYRLQHLSPATTYHVSVQTFCSDLRGSPSQEVTFETLPCKPSSPTVPKLLARTKTSLTLRWSIPSITSTHAKICAYILEWDEGQGEGQFTELYQGQQRQFKVSKLHPGKSYCFRLAFLTDVGQSDFSEPVSYSTTAPSTLTSTTNSHSATLGAPYPPTLREAYADALHLEWQPRLEEDCYTLQMEEHLDWKQIYFGHETHFLCLALQTNTEYRFRLRITTPKNEESSWSPVASFRTLAPKQATPSPPLPKPEVLGPVLPTSLLVHWETNTIQDEGRIFRLEMDKGSGFEVIHSGPEQEFLVENLTPGTCYHFRLSSGSNLYSEVTSITTPSASCPEKCSPPFLETIPLSPHLPLGLAWSSSPSSSWYEVEIQHLEEGKSWKVYAGKENHCEVPLENLSHPGASYHFAVRAVGKGGPSPWSEPLELQAAPGPPQEPSALPTSPNTAMLSWQPPAHGGTFTYCLEYTDAPHPANFQELYKGPNTCYNVCDLLPASLYHFRVQGVSSCGLLGPYSPVFSCQTPPKPPGMISVSSVNCQASSHSLQITWNEPEDCGGAPILGYTIRISPFKSSTVTTDNPSLFLQDLLPKTSYVFAISSFNAAGSSDFCPDISLQTLAMPPQPPSLLDCMVAGHSSLRLRWTPSPCSKEDANELIYTLEMANRLGSFYPIYQGVGLQYKVSKLHENSSYQFRICATSPSLGTGPFSPIAVFRTCYAPPLSLKAPRISQVTSSSCLVEWLQVKCPDPVSYQLQLISKSNESYKTVYQGESTSFLLENLDPRTTYLVRVGAIRHLPHREAPLHGPFGAGTAFTTLPPPPTVHIPQEESPSWSDLISQMDDNHYAVFIVLILTLLSFFIATWIQGLVASSNHLAH